MRRALLISLRMAALTVVLFGLVYPAVVWAIGRVFVPAQADGSLVRVDGAVVGSTLIGQGFSDDRYFHGRPSAAGDGYDAMASGASNLGPTSSDLAEAVSERVTATIGKNPGSRHGAIPVDLVTASGSGLDPHISPDAANLQAPRVARATGLPLVDVKMLIAQHTDGRQLGVLGEPRVNVLELNLALDKLSSK